MDKSILIVEDEGLFALHLMETLINAGYQVLGGKLLVKRF